MPTPRAICTKACGTGGFFLGAHNRLTRPGQTLIKKHAAFLRQQTFYGNEIVPGTRRLCLMNLFLHIVAMLCSRGKAAVVLPTGIFCAQGVKANVVFFEARPKDGTVQTQGVWIHDLRRNKDDSLDNPAGPPPPDMLPQEIIEHLEAALAAFRRAAAKLPTSARAGAGLARLSAGVSAGRARCCGRR